MISALSMFCMNRKLGVAGLPLASLLDLASYVLDVPGGRGRGGGLKNIHTHFWIRQSTHALKHTQTHTVNVVCPCDTHITTHTHTQTQTHTHTQ